MNICSELVFLVICVWGLGQIFGIGGVWAGFAVGNALLALFYVLRALCRKHTMGKGAQKLLMLPEGFGVPDSDTFTVAIENMNDVIALSENVQSFCADHNIDGKRSYWLALCIEEMAGNIVKHGFSDGKEHSLDISVVVKNDDILLKLRDDCMYFDIKEKMKNWSLDPDNPAENMGIRIVLGLSKDVTYANTMNSNNLLIKL